MVILLRYIHCNGLISHFPAMHFNLLCACWYSWALKGSSSLSFCRLPISLRFTSCLLLCPKLTDAPHSDPGTRPPLPFPKWRLHSQGPHTLPFQDTRQLYIFIWMYVYIYEYCTYMSPTLFFTCLSHKVLYIVFLIKRIILEGKENSLWRIMKEILLDDKGDILVSGYWSDSPWNWFFLSCHSFSWPFLLRLSYLNEYSLYAFLNIS